MKKFAVFTLVLASLTLPSLASAQNRPTGRPDTAATTPAPTAAPSHSAGGSPHAGSLGAALGINTNWASGVQIPSFGINYYLDQKLELFTNLTLSLAGQGVKSNLTGAPAATNTSTPEFQLLVGIGVEDRIGTNAAWSWGGFTGLAYSGSETSGGGSSAKDSTNTFILYLGGLANFKYFFVPNIAVYLQPALSLQWIPSSNHTVTNAAGTKTTDDTTSSLKLSTQTSSLGVVFYLN